MTILDTLEDRADLPQLLPSNNSFTINCLLLRERLLEDAKAILVW